MSARIVGTVNGEHIPANRSRLEVLPWSLEGGTLVMSWSGGGKVFSETVRFPATVPREPWVEQVIDLLTVVSSLSYAKALAPVTISLGSSRLTAAGRALVESACSDGMAEFAHQTGINSPIAVESTNANVADTRAEASSGERPLIPLGGGRDSAVVACALDGADPILLSIGGSAAAQRVAAALDRDLVVVTREIDDQILELNAAGAPNGHIPITAITMLVSVLCAAALGADAVVMANEASASTPTRVVDGVAVNHQHSKSHVFEMLLHDALASIGSPVGCFSVLRDRDDTDISRVFADKCASVHRAVVSCNRAGVRDASRRSTGWCCDCAKCRSVYLSLAPHMTPSRLSSIFGGDLLADPAQTAGFAELLDDATKPFECVQTTDEARAAVLQLAGSGDWSGHSVVVALAERGAARVSATAAGLGDHVPTRIRVAMEEFFS